MTTYPLSEPATIYAAKGPDHAMSVLGQGKLEECVDMVSNMSADEQKSIYIQMDDIDLKFDSQEISDLLTYLHEESPGLSDNEISEIKSQES